jgi:hypothetical protein
MFHFRNTWSGAENGAERVEKRVSGSEAVSGACENRVEREWSAEREVRELGRCGYTHTRGYTRTRPVPAGRVRVGYTVCGYGLGACTASRVRVQRVYPYI